MVKPNFFIVGAPKCGTTALSRYLGTHPSVFFSPMKEPRYFDFDLRKPTPLDLKGYLALFVAADPAVHLAVGEGSTSYLFSENAVPAILEFNPDAKFIVMLRNPVDLVQALHSEQIFWGMENIPGFEEAWRAEGGRKKGKNLPLICPEPRQLAYSEWGKLGGQVERMLRIVPKEKVRIILFEDFTKDPRGEYEGVLDFLGLGLDGRNDFPRINENKRIRSVRLQQWMRFIGGRFMDARKKMGFKNGFGIMSRFHRLNRSVEGRKSIPERFRMELKDFYREDILKLSAIIGRDLSSWVS